MASCKGYLTPIRQQWSDVFFCIKAQLRKRKWPVTGALIISLVLAEQAAEQTVELWVN